METDMESRYIGGLHALFQKQDLFEREGITREFILTL